MPKKQRCRNICSAPRVERFLPEGEQVSGDRVTLSCDEFEAIRLIDYERRTQQQTAAQMHISRTTVAEIYASARRQLAEALLDGLEIEISGGYYHLCDGTNPYCFRPVCLKTGREKEHVD